jgi:hypothetical protein
MPPAKGLRAGKLADVAAPPAEPDVPYRIADEDLYIYHPDAGALPARAFNAGDRVPADLVDAYGWHDLTHIPEWATAPPATAPEPSGPAKGGSED